MSKIIQNSKQMAEIGRNSLKKLQHHHQFNASPKIETLNSRPRVTANPSGVPPRMNR